MSERAQSFPYKVAIEVPFRDLDAMGHVNNAVYFSYMETARIKYLVDLLAVTSLHDLPVIMAEATYRGQLNAPDMVTRLILSIAATGVAPGSFYAREASGVRPRAHFDGLPVDFVAEAVSALTVEGSRNVKGFWTYHVMNPHDDGIGLDEYVDWMMQAGCRIDRISGYDDWLARFETALRNLPERQRNASLLPLLVSFRHPQPVLSGAFASTHSFRKAVAEAGIGIGGAIPAIDRRIIEKYISDLELLGLLDPSMRALAGDDERKNECLTASTSKS